MSRNVKVIKGCEFEIWEKSIRMVSPTTSPVFYSPEKMSSVGIPETYADKIIETMNAGICMYIYRQSESKSFRIGEDV